LNFGLIVRALLIIVGGIHYQRVAVERFNNYEANPEMPNVITLRM